MQPVAVSDSRRAPWGTRAHAARSRTPQRTRRRRGLTSPQPFSAGGSQLSGGAARSHSISPAAAPPGAATAPNPWPWPAKPGLSDATAGGGRPRAAHHRSQSPPGKGGLPRPHLPSPVQPSPAPLPPLTLCSHLHLFLSTTAPPPDLPLLVGQPPSRSSGWLEPHPQRPSLSLPCRTCSAPPGITHCTLLAHGLQPPRAPPLSFTCSAALAARAPPLPYLDL